MNGPTSRTLFRGWTGSGGRAVDDLWKELGEHLVRVQVDGRRYDLPEALLPALLEAPKPEGVVLVPPHDPFLRQVDRSLLVPDTQRRHDVWRALSGPGALLVDAEVAGTWRYRRSEHELTLTAFDPIPPARRRQAETSAVLIARASADDRATVTWA